MREVPILDQATADVLHRLIEGAEHVHLVGDPSTGAADRLRGSLPAPFAPAQAAYDTVVVLDPDRLDQAEAAVAPQGTLIVAAVNPHYGWFLLRALEGEDVPGAPAPELDRVCARLESAGWEIADATPVTVPLALVPFDPARIPKTVFAYLYARHPELETYCVLLRARRATGPPRRFRPMGLASLGDVPTGPWKTEGEWRDERARWGEPPAVASATPDPGGMAALEHTERMVDALRLDLARRKDELGLITSSLTWRAIVAYRKIRERVLPPPTRRGRVYERVRAAVGRVARSRRDGD